MINNNGVVNTYYIQHIQRTEELNERINERNVPIFQTTQNLSFRSVPTKHTLIFAHKTASFERKIDRIRRCKCQRFFWNPQQ